MVPPEVVAVQVKDQLEPTAIGIHGVKAIRHSGTELLHDEQPRPSGDHAASMLLGLQVRRTKSSPLLPMT